MSATTRRDRGGPTTEERLAARCRPDGSPVMWQSWKQLLFLHWRWPVEDLQRRLPAGLRVDTWEGEGWIGVVPFFMRDVRFRGMPGIPTATNFLELNCRTYVVDEATGVPGVWFFSLDANSWLAVRGARWGFGLPYWWARMSADTGEDGHVDFRSRRRKAPADLATRFVYSPTATPAPVEPGTLEFFLVERYVLFTVLRNGRLVPGRVSHQPYACSPARVDSYDANLLRLCDFEPRDRPCDHTLFSPGVDVEVFAPGAPVREG